MSSMGTLRRTHYSADLVTATHGETVVVAGSIARSRNLGGVVFADLRDTTGLVQLAFDSETDPAIFNVAESLRAEYVVMAEGELRQRESVNKALPTGDVEVFVTDLRLLSKAQTPPFEIRDDINVNDELRLRYRYLDLRREALHSTLHFRSLAAQKIREFYLGEQFVEIETPMLIKSTPEGARDYLVPSRVQPGHFYALPQSPQLYKQILMLSGYDRYFQIARCFRDEDLRADRQPEFTQIDMEMAFADASDVQTVNENLVKYVFKETLDVDIATPFPRMPYTEAMERFGSDKPDTRFGLELCDVSDLLKDTEFRVFSGAIADGGSVRLINAKGLADELSRRVIDGLTETAKTYGAKGLAFLRLTDDAESSSYEKFLSDDEKEAVRQRAGAEKGDVLLLVADKDSVAFAALGALRLALARDYDLIDTDGYNFLWVVDFPLFEYSEEEDRYVAMHHPFTMPLEEDIDKIDTDRANCRANAYDMVVNGVELGGGSVRINDPELQAKMFRSLGFTDEIAERDFGFLMEAYRYGAPPHAGMAFGFDRMVAMMCGKESIRDVIAFPKVQNASELMSGTPETVDQKQLDELYLSVEQKKKDADH